jgi:hypothetical protein
MDKKREDYGPPKNKGVKKLKRKILEHLELDNQIGKHFLDVVSLLLVIQSNL